MSAKDGSGWDYRSRGRFSLASRAGGKITPRSCVFTHVSEPKVSDRLPLTRSGFRKCTRERGQVSGVQHAVQYPNLSCFAGFETPQPPHFVSCSAAGIDDFTCPRSHAYSLRFLPGFLPRPRETVTDATL